jgi:hypothetical protein
MSEFDFEVERDEIDEVLSVLEGLLSKVSSPVVRACLEGARDDIAHLCDKGEEAAA